MADYSLNVYSSDGSTIRTTIKKYQYNGTFMGDRNVTATISSAYKIDWNIGDYITLRGEKYKLRYIPSAKKQARRGTYGEAYQYDGVTFSSIIGDLMNIQMLDYVKDDNLIHYTGLSTFSFYVANQDMTEFKNRLLANIERVYGTGKWNIVIATAGVDVYNGETKIVEGCDFDFDDASVSISTGTTVYNALCLVNTQFDLNFFVRTINGVNTIIIGGNYCSIADTLGYGKGRGLKSIQQSHNNNETIITRLHAYGSTRNLPYRYYNKKYNNQKKYPLMFDDDGNFLLESRYINKLMLPYDYWVKNGTLWDCYIDSDRLAEVGLFEGEVTFDGSDEDWDEIYPSLEDMNVSNWKVGMTVYESGYGINRGTYITRIRTSYYNIVREKFGMDSSQASESATEMANSLKEISTITGNASTAKSEVDSCLVSAKATAESSTSMSEVTASDDYAKIIEVINCVFTNGDAWTDLDTTSYKHELQSDEKAKILATTHNGEGRLDAVNSNSSVTDNGVSADGSYDDGSQDTAGNVINSWFELTIPQIGFDIEDWVDTDENSAVLCMKTGMCAGMEFTIASCIAVDTNDYSKGWKLTLQRYQNSDVNMVYPNTSYQIKSGDQYVLTGIDMPDIYVESAESRLYDQALEYLADVEYDKYTYNLEIDSKYMVENPVVSSTIFEGMSLVINDYDADDDGTGVGDLGLGEQAIVISQLTISYNEEALPKYTVVLKEDTQQAVALQDVVNASVKKANTSFSNNITELKKLIEKKLSKVDDDIAEGLITFAKGILINGDVYKIDSEGKAKLYNLLVNEKYGIESSGSSRAKSMTFCIDDDEETADSKSSAMSTNNYQKDMSTGKGWGVDNYGNGQFESLEIRSALRVLELVYNRLSAEESEYVFTESGTIESLTANSDGTYTCVMKKRNDTDFHAFHKGDILRGIVNDLTNLGGGSYYTSWLLVKSTDTQTDNSIIVSVYDDADTPAQKNYPPAQHMVVQRWGNNVTPSAEAHANEEYSSFITQKSDNSWVNTRQSCWYISSIEKRIAMLDGVSQPIITEDNYSAFFGLPYSLDSFKEHTLDSTQPYLYVRGAFLQDIYRIDYKGNTMKEERFRGNWDYITANMSSTDEDYNPYIVTETTYDTVYHNNAKWQCSGSVGVAVKEEPSSASTKWTCLQQALAGSDAIDYECDFDLKNLLYNANGEFSTDSVVLSFFKSESDTRSAFSVSKVEMQLKKANGTCSTYSLTENDKSTYTLQPSSLLSDDDLASDFISLEVVVTFTSSYSKTFLLGIIDENQKGQPGESAVQYSISSPYTFITIGTDGTTKTPNSPFDLSIYKTTGSSTTAMSMVDGYVDDKYLQISLDGNCWTKIASMSVSSEEISSASSSIRVRLVNQNVSTETNDGLIVYAITNIPVISNAIAPTIRDGKWVINGVQTDFVAIGDDGHTPYINDGYWYEWNSETSAYQNTNIKAEGIDGADGVQDNLYGYDNKLYTGVGKLVHTKTGFGGITTSDSDGNIFLNVYKDADGIYFPIGEKIAVSCTIKVTDISNMPSSFYIALSLQGGVGTKIYDQVEAVCGTEYSLVVNGAYSEKAYFPYLVIRTGVANAQALVEVTDFKIESAENLVGLSTPFTGLADDTIIQQPNLLLDTLFADSSKWDVFKGAKVSNLYRGVDGFQWTGNINAGAEYDCLRQDITGKLRTNMWYTFSYYSKLENGTAYDTFIYPSCCDTTKITIQDDVAMKGRSDSAHIVKSTDSVNAWKRHIITFCTPSTLQSTYYIMFRVSNADGTSSVTPTLSIAMPKLEEGEKVTAWQLNESDRKGESGESPVSIINNNQADQLPTDCDGKVVTSTSISCVVYVEKGSSVMSSTAPSASDVTLAGITPTITTESNKHTLTWIFNSGFTASEDKYSVSIPIVYGGNQYSTLFSLAVVKSGEKGVSPKIYNLAPTMTTMSFAKSSDGLSLTPDSLLVGCGYITNCDGVITSYRGSLMANICNIDGKYTIFRRFVLADGTYSTWSQLYNFSSTSYKVQVKNTDTYSAVEFALSSATSYAEVADTNIIDRQTIQINRDGIDGNDAKLLTLSASRSVISCDKDWNPSDTTAIEVNANLTNLTGNVTWSVSFDDSGDDEDCRTISGNKLTIDTEKFCSDWTFVSITATLDGYSSSIKIGMVRDGSTGATGATGASAKMLTLSADRTVVATDSSYVPQDTTSISVTAGLINITGTPTWSVKDKNGNTISSSIYSVSGNVLSLSAYAMQSYPIVVITASVTYGGTTYSQTIKIGRVCNGMSVKGEDAKPLRIRKWEVDAVYQGGATTDTFQDIVYIEGVKEMYLCHYTHTANATTNNPDNTQHQSTSSWSATVPWSATDWVDMVATSVLFANKSKINNLQVDDVLIQDEDGNNKVVLNKDEVYIDATIVTPSKEYDSENDSPIIIDVDNNRSVTIKSDCSSNRMVVLPMYNEQTMVNGTTIPSYQKSGAHIYINVQSVPHLANWRYFSNSKYFSIYSTCTSKDNYDVSTGLYRGQIISYINEGAVLVCADALQVYAKTENNFEHGLAGADPFNDNSYLHGRFNINGATARFILLMPGQTLSLRSSVETYINEDYDEDDDRRVVKYLTWYVENGNEFVNLYQQMWVNNQSSDNYSCGVGYTFKSEPTTIDQTSDPFWTTDDWQDMIFGSKVFDANLFINNYGNSSNAVSIDDTPHVMLVRCRTSDMTPSFYISD